MGLSGFADPFPPVHHDEAVRHLDVRDRGIGGEFQCLAIVFFTGFALRTIMSPDLRCRAWATRRGRGRQARQGAALPWRLPFYTGVQANYLAIMRRRRIRLEEETPCAISCPARLRASRHHRRQRALTMLHWCARPDLY
jgi:hypothetical protein